MYCFCLEKCFVVDRGWHVVSNRTTCDNPFFARLQQLEPKRTIINRHFGPDTGGRTIIMFFYAQSRLWVVSFTDRLRDPYTSWPYRAPVRFCVFEPATISTYYSRFTNAPGGRLAPLENNGTHTHTFDLHVRFGFPSNSCAPSGERDPATIITCFVGDACFQGRPFVYPTTIYTVVLFRVPPPPLPPSMFRRVLCRRSGFVRPSVPASNRCRRPDGFR